VGLPKAAGQHQLTAAFLCDFISERWKIVIKVLTCSKLQKFNGSFVDINTEAITGIFNFEKFATAFK
jgi:hypothetical protein